MPTIRIKRDGFLRPPVDEWGVYDPKQAGFAAVYARVKSRRRMAAAPTIVGALPRTPVGIGTMIRSRKKAR